MSRHWSTEAAWTWRRPTHINLLETASVYRLCKRLATFSGPLRFCSLCDSNVARCAITKGRSPSHGLAKGLKRVAAVCLSHGLYPQLPFCPTRLMPADHPTRDAPFPCPGLTFVPSHATCAELSVRRWLANWVRLVCLSTPSLPITLTRATALVHGAPTCLLRWSLMPPWVFPVKGLGFGFGWWFGFGFFQGSFCVVA